MMAEARATERAASDILGDALTSGAMRQDVTVVLVFRRFNDYTRFIAPELR